jgi:hypothetical protein
MKKPKYKHLKKPEIKKSDASVRNERASEDDMLEDYSFLDWSKAERGKYARRYAEGTNLVLIAPDLIDLFPNAESVNRALRAMADIIRASSANANPRKRVTSQKAK